MCSPSSISDGSFSRSPSNDKCLKPMGALGQAGRFVRPHRPDSSLDQCLTHGMAYVPQFTISARLLSRIECWRRWQFEPIQIPQPRSH